jgi:hypothetical protein
MELQFDKEIDAILRRSGEDRAVLVGDDPPEKPKPHLDADAVAAFVENALPDKAKRLYMEHFADCGGCRKLLTQSILMRETAAPAAAPAAEIVDAAAAVPWYSKLFRTPNLALAMGALVLTFSGVLGYLMLQNRDSQNATVSQVADQQRPSDPYSIGSGTAANIASNTVTSANSAADTAASAPINTPPPGAANTGTGPAFSADGVAVDDRFTGGQPEAKPAEKPADAVTTTAPPPPPPAPRVGAVREEPSILSGVTLDSATKEDKDENTELAKRKVVVDDRNRRDMPASPAKSGPARAAGPVQMQSNQVNTQTFEMAVTRKVGGRTFENKIGAWYDRKYTGQATINVRRGTDEFTNLDKGLRNIANELDGVVVVVWKSKAYRIQ